MSYHHEDQTFRNQLWQKRSKIFLSLIAFTLYWLLVLTIPYFIMAGTGGKHNFFKLGFFLPIFGVIFAFSSFSKSSPIYKTSKDDVPVIILFAFICFLFPLFAHLHEIQNIEIAPSIWTLAQVFSVCLGICTGIMFFRRLRKDHISLGLPIIMGLLATSIGGLLGAIIFKIISLVMSYT